MCELQIYAETILQRILKILVNVSSVRKLFKNLAFSLSYNDS